jgi:hypothetical protein
VNPWPFIVGAYGLTLVASAALTLWSYLAMRRAEADVGRLGK